MTLEMFDKQVKTVGMLINSILEEVALHNIKESNNPLLVVKVATISEINPYIDIIFKEMQGKGYRYTLSLTYDARYNTISYRRDVYNLELISDTNYREIPTPEIQHVAKMITKTFLSVVDNTPFSSGRRGSKLVSSLTALDAMVSRITDCYGDNGQFASVDYSNQEAYIVIPSWDGRKPIGVYRVSLDRGGYLRIFNEINERKFGKNFALISVEEIEEFIGR